MHTSPVLKHHNAGTTEAIHGWAYGPERGTESSEKSYMFTLHEYSRKQFEIPECLSTENSRAETTPASAQRRTCKG